MLLVLILGACPGGRTTVRLLDGRPTHTRYVSPSAYEHYLRGRVALNRNRPDVAIRQWRAALLFDDSSPYIFCELARLLIKQRRYAEADQLIERALDIDKGYVQAHVAFGLLQLALDKTAAAEKAFRKAIAAGPKATEPYLRYAELLQKTGRITQAREQLERLVKVSERKAGLVPLGRFCAHRMDLACAEEALREAANRNPGDLPTSFLWIRVLRGQGKFRQARDELRHLLSHSKAGPRIAHELLEVLAHLEDRRGLSDLAMVLSRSAAHDEAPLSHLVQSLLELGHPRLAARAMVGAATTPLVQIARARTAMALGDLEGARKLLLPLRNGKQGPWASQLLVKVATRRGKHQRAEKELARALQKAPTNTLLLRTMLDLSNAPRRSARLLATALTKSPKNSELQLLTALAHARAKDWRRAIRTAEVVLSQNKKSAAAHNFIGYVLADNKQQLKRAERQIFRALALRPLATFAVDSLGWLRFRQGRLLRAQHLLEVAWRLSAADPEVAAHLAQVLEARGEHGRARLFWRRAIAHAENQRSLERWRAALARSLQR